MRKACRLSPCSLAFLLAIAATAAWGQLEINSSPNPVGSGARALGMGGAFIAIADDATSASWNPGGLTQLERPELSLVYSYKWLSEDINSGTHPELSSSQDVNFGDINYFSFVYPIRRTIGGRNLVVSINYQKKYDFDRDLNLRYNDIAAGGGGYIGMLRSRVDYSQRGSLAAISPAFGFEITDTLSVGATVNLWDQSLLPDNEWKVRNTQRVITPILNMVDENSFTKRIVEEDYEDFRGTNYTLGFLYKPTERFSVGGVYQSKFTADMKYKLVTRTQNRLIGFAYTRDRRPLEYTFPSAVGLGLSYRFPNEKLTLSLDVTRWEWDQFIIHDDDLGKGLMRARRQYYAVGLSQSFLGLRGQRRRSGVTGLPANISNVDPTYVVRLGGEYVFVDDTRPVQHYLPSLRAGVFYDPEPSGGQASWPFGLRKGDGEPNDFYGISLGAGVLIRDRVNIDMAYSYRWGDNARSDTFHLPRTDMDVAQHMLYLSTVIYF